MEPILPLHPLSVLAALFVGNTPVGLSLRPAEHANDKATARAQADAKVKRPPRFRFRFRPSRPTFQEISLDEACRFAGEEGLSVGWFGLRPMAFGEFDPSGNLCGAVIAARPRCGALDDGVTLEVQAILHREVGRRRALLAGAMTIVRQCGFTRMLIGERAGRHIDLKAIGFMTLLAENPRSDALLGRVLRWGERIK